MNIRSFQRWLYMPLWQQIRYKGKFGHPDRLGFVSLSALGHRPAPATPATSTSSGQAPERPKVFHLADYTNFPFFLTEFRGRKGED